MKGVTHLEFRKALYRELFKQGSEESLQKKRRHSAVQPSDVDDHEVDRIHPRKWCQNGSEGKGSRSHFSKAIPHSLLLQGVRDSFMQAGHKVVLG